MVRPASGRLHVGEDTQTVLEITFGPQPPKLFELPEDAVVAERGG